MLCGGSPRGRKRPPPDASRQQQQQPLKRLAAPSLFCCIGGINQGRQSRLDRMVLPCHNHLQLSVREDEDGRVEGGAGGGGAEGGGGGGWGVKSALHFLHGGGRIILIGHVDGTAAGERRGGAGLEAADQRW